MLRALIFTASLAFGGCSVVRHDAWTFDATHPQPHPVADPVQIAPLTNRIAGLQSQLSDVRARIAAQPNASQRLSLYSEEHDIGVELSRRQRELGRYAQAH